MSEVLISLAPISYPRARTLNILVSLNQESARANIADLAKDGLFVIDPDLVTEPPRPDAIPIPCTRLAFKVAKAQIAANMVALGAVAELCPLVSEGAIRRAIKGRLSARIQDINLKAFKAGQKEAAPFARAARDR